MKYFLLGLFIFSGLGSYSQTVIIRQDQQIKKMVEKYKPVRIEIDAGALGKKISEEIIRRHNLPVHAAEKHRKLEFIELMNDDLRTGKLMIKKSSLCAEDMSLVQWDIIEKDRRTISKSFHSDITDAVLYAWRYANHFFNEIVIEVKFTGQAQVDTFWEKQEVLAEKRKSGAVEWWEE